MNCGTILFDQQYQFPNTGAISPKLLVFLCEFGTDYLVLITTSQPHSKNNKPGCHLADDPPNYFLPKGSCWFNDDTWILLDEVHEVSSTILAAKRRGGGVTEYRDKLSTSLIKDILDCALQSNDIEEFYREFLEKLRNSL